MKKIAIILAAVITMQINVVSASADYTDVSGHWAEGFINKLTNEGIVEGDKVRFRPDSYVNVDEFIKMTLTAMKIEITPQGGNWSAPYIEKALEKKLIYKDEFDRYDRPITRSELVKISVRAIGADYVRGDEREQLISRISDYYDIYNADKEYVLAAYSKHLLSGYEDNSFRSSRYTTRAEACVITDRMITAGNFTMSGGNDNNNNNTTNPIINAANTIVVADSGNDSNAGTQEAPLKTLEKARDKVREIIAAGAYPDGGITVYLREGEYVFDKSLELGAADSGTDGNPVTYTSYPGEVARITGGVKLPYSEFKAASADITSKLIDKTVADKVLEIDLGKLGIEDLGVLSRRGYLIESGIVPQAELYIDGSRMNLSKWPNSDWVGTTGIVRSGARNKTGVLEGAAYKIDYDRPTKWKTNINEIYTSGVLGPNYFYGYFPIEKIESGQITLKEGSVTEYYSKHFIRYENILEEIDEPGEYYIDRNTKMLYLYPQSGFGEGSDIRLSQIGENLITGSNISNVTFKNLKFDCSRAGAIRLNGATNVTVENCEVADMGSNGVYLNGTGCVVKNCLIHDIGRTGVSITGGDYENRISGGNVVTNNHIYKAAQIERSYQAGILIGHQSVGTTVSHNELHDMPHTALIIYGPDHTIEYNNIYDAVKEFHDMDAIYMNVYQYPWERNVVIRRNFIHDLGQQTFTERQMNVAGIRTDNNGNGLQVLENVFYNIGYQNSNGIRGVCAQGIDNVVNGNIFVDTAGTYEGAHTYNPDAKWDIQSDSVKGTYAQWQKYSPVYSQKNPEVMDFFKNHFGAYKNGNKFMNNLVVNIKFPLSTLNGNPTADGFNANEQLVEASGNIVTKSDPGFVNYNGKDFTLKDDSEVYSKNKDFPKIDFNNIGLLKEETVGVKK